MQPCDTDSGHSSERLPYTGNQVGGGGARGTPLQWLTKFKLKVWVKKVLLQLTVVWLSLFLLHAHTSTSTISAQCAALGKGCAP